MRESIGGAWLYGLVIGFIFLFAAFLTVAINYSKVFRVKNEVTSIAEKYEGFSNSATVGTKIIPGSLETIGNYIKSVGYVNKGSCPNEGTWYGFVETTNSLVPANNGKYLFCVRKNVISKTTTGNYIDPTTGNRRTYTKKNYYYDLVFFFKIDLPIIGELSTFRIADQSFNVMYDSKNLSKNADNLTINDQTQR